MKIFNIAKRVLENGGKLSSLAIPSKETGGLGLMNPSIMVDEDKLIMILRQTNYTLFHAENEQIFNSRWGPLSYLNPENDVTLRTTNYYCELNDNLEIKKHFKIDTSKLDVPPKWTFIGLEDARIVRWNGKLYTAGVRRDIKPNGEGRMELCEIIVHEDRVEEISRFRIPPPNDPNSYCEKNWMPVMDMPYHFIKWTDSTELVVVDPENKTCKTVFLGTKKYNTPDQRGSSQVIPWGDHRLCITHELQFFKNKLEQKDAYYLHRFIVWDKEWNLIRMSKPFSFMTGEIEFCCGATFYKNDLLVTFGFQDNAAFLLKIPSGLLNEIIMED